MIKLLTCLLFPILSLAQFPNRNPTTNIYDFSNSLTRNETQQLNGRLFQLEKQTSVQMLIVLFDYLSKDTSTENYTRFIGNIWNVGTNHKGIIYLAALEEHKYCKNIWKNLEEISGLNKFHLIENIKPYINGEYYYSALQSLVSAIFYKFKVQVNAPANTSVYGETECERENDPNSEAYKKQQEKYDHLATKILLVILGLAAVFCYWAFIVRKKYVESYTRDGVYTGIGSPEYKGTTKGFDIIPSTFHNRFPNYNIVSTNDNDEFGILEEKNKFSGGGASGIW